MLNDTSNWHIPILAQPERTLRVHVQRCQDEVLHSKMPWVRRTGTMDLVCRGPSDEPTALLETKDCAAFRAQTLSMEMLQQADIEPGQLGPELWRRFEEAVRSRKCVWVFKGSYNMGVYWLRGHFELVAMLWAAQSQYPEAYVGLLPMEWQAIARRWAPSALVNREFMGFWVKPRD
jgi:hypothetical protein